MQTDLSTLIAPEQAEIQPQRGGTPEPTDAVKLEAIVSVAELMEKGSRSTGVIMEHLQKNYGYGNRNTAIKYRNLAMTLLAREHKPMNRENMRALEVGRLQYHIERIYGIIQEHADQTKLEARENKWYDTHAKLWSKLNDFGARLHAITGLNEITINNETQSKRIIFMRPGDKMPTSHNIEVQVSDVTEGETVEPQPTNQLT